jgi:hypothetical protein
MALTPEQAAALGLPVQQAPAAPASRALSAEQATSLGLPQPPKPSYLAGLAQRVGGVVLPSRGSPLGAVVSGITGGASDAYQPEGIYSAPLYEQQERRAGESAREYAVRDAKAAFEFAKSPEGIAGILPVAAVALPGSQRAGTTKAPRIQQTPEAATLASQGVKLTTGQRAPQHGWLAQLEKVSTHNPLGMQAEREAAEQSFMRGTQNKGVAPGAQVPATTDLQGRLGELFQGFDLAYGQIKNKPIDPKVVATLPDAAVMPGRGVDPRTAAGVKAEVENALGVLGDGLLPPKSAHGHGAPAAAPKPLLYGPNNQPLPVPPKAPPKATAGDLMKVRENIREQMRAARQSQDFDKLRLLESAEDVVTQTLETSLSPQDAAHLKATDRQYARLMTAANAAPAGQTTFTPGQYLRSVERSAGRRTFKKGEAGDLQDLGEAARTVFQNAPQTGFRTTVLSALGPVGRYGAAPISRLANTDFMQRFLFEPRAKPPTVGPNANTFALQLANALRGKVRGAPAPALAEEEGR